MKIALISGWGLAASVWPLAYWQALGHQVLALDLSLDAAQFAQLCKQHDFDYLVGWSLGGVRALEWALMTRAKVILLASLPIMVQRADFAGGISSSAFEQFAQAFAQDSAAAMQHFVGLLSLGNAQPRLLQKQLHPHLLPGDLSARHLSALKSADGRAAWSVLQQQQRLQAVFAQQDALLTAVSVQQALAELPPIAVQWIRGGHAASVLNPSLWMPHL